MQQVTTVSYFSIFEYTFNVLYLGNSTGERSVYTAYKGFEIMFHVATMLPYNPHDEQQVCKKRHIGNDVVVIIFKENNIPFDPLWMRSQFNR